MAHDQSRQNDMSPQPGTNLQPLPESAPRVSPVEPDFIQNESVPARQAQPNGTDTMGTTGSTDSNIEFVEPNLPTEEQVVAPEDVQPMSTDEFAQDDPRHIYERLRPDQRTAIAGEFIRLFRLSGDPEAQRYDTEIHEMWPAERVAELHRYAQQRHPEIFEEVMRHPVTVASLETPGVVVRTGSEGEEVAPDVVPDIPEKHDVNLLP